MKTAAFLAGFGGPEKASEVRPFLESVLEGVKIPPARLEAVAQHYDAVGGVSAYNAEAFSLKHALEEKWKKEPAAPALFVGFRHSAPSFTDVFRQMNEKSFSRVVVFVMAPFRSYPSFGKYQDRIEAARHAADADAVDCVFTEPFFGDPLFVEAQARRITDTLAAIPFSERAAVYAIFSAHSIPEAMAAQSRYAEEFAESAAAIAGKAGLAHWTTAYQSRSGNPADPWLSPSVEEVFEKIDPARFKHLALVPSGFFCENVEIAYDLDMEARRAAEARGFIYHRARAVAGEAAFTELVSRLLLEKAGVQ